MAPTKLMKTEVEPASHLRRLLDLESKSKGGPISSPTYATVKPSQYRNSYPPSRRGAHVHSQLDEFHAHDGQTSARFVPDPSVQGEGLSRPRRSSLRQPQDFNKMRRRKSTSAKRVHFSMEETVYEMFGPRDVQKVDQVLDLLRIPSRRTPYTSSHSVTLRLSEAARDYPEPTVSSRERIRSVRPLSAELVEGNVTPESRSHGSQMPQSGVQMSYQGHPELKSRRSSQRQSDSHHEHQSQPHADEVDYRQFRGENPDTRSEGHKSQNAMEPKPDHHSSSHYQTRSSSHTEPRSNSDSHSQSHLSEHVENAAPTRQRSSISSDETLISPEVTWATAPKVMFAKQQGRSESIAYADKPVINQPEEKTSLHRSCAQRLPKVPRRHKLLRNLAKMFE